jgi:NAD(P)-dependent dehydrogenase (short-subunit alcohol dehydrogenase family)
VNVRSALVTGAAQGLGLATSRRLARDGYRVTMADINESLVVDSADQLRAEGLDVIADVIDVTSDDSVAACFARLGPRLDVLVNNAGIISRGPIERIESRAWDRELAVALGGTMRCGRAAFPLLRDTPGASVVNLASVASTLGLPLRLAYSTAKTGIVGLTRTMAAEWGRRGIRVNAVAPGYIETPMMLSGLEAGVLDRDRLLSRTPLMRFGRADEIAAAISFLVSPNASFITGITLNVDGGITIDGTFQLDETYKTFDVS